MSKRVPSNKPKRPLKTANQPNAFSPAGVRHPNRLPQSVQWKLQGDAQFIRTLPAYEALWMASFLEAEFGDNPQTMGYNQDESRAVWNRSKANERDVLTQCKGRDRVSLEAYDTNLVQSADERQYPSKLSERQTVHIDVCTKGNEVNHVENALIEILDTQPGRKGNVIELKANASRVHKGRSPKRK